MNNRPTSIGGGAGGKDNGQMTDIEAIVRDLAARCKHCKRAAKQATLAGPATALTAPATPALPDWSILDVTAWAHAVFREPSDRAAAEAPR